MVAMEALPPSGEEVCIKCQGGPGHACRGDVWAQFLLNFSKTVELVCSNSHCWVGEEGSQAFMKILWSLSLQSMQLLLTGWYSDLSCKTRRGSARQRWGYAQAHGQQQRDGAPPPLQPLRPCA